METRFTEKPEPVKFYPASKNSTTVFIALNPREETEMMEDGTEVTYWVADTNEFILSNTVIDKEDIIQNPEKWFEYIGNADYLQKSVTDAIQAHMDAVAQTRGYDGILSLASYASSDNERFGPEGKAGLAWRDAVWAYGYALLDDVLSGKREIPTIEEIIEELPEMVWPT